MSDQTEGWVNVYVKKKDRHGVNQYTDGTAWLTRLEAEVAAARSPRNWRVPYRFHVKMKKTDCE